MQLLDFQISKRSIPISDVTYFLCASGNEEVLNNLPKYIDYYYESLRLNCKSYDLEVEDLYPRARFDEHCRKYFCFGVFLAAFIFKVMLTHSHKTKTLEEASEVSENISDSMFDMKGLNLEEYLGRMRTVIDSLEKFDYI